MYKDQGVLQEIEGKVQDIKTKSYARLIEALQHNWKTITAKTHKLMPVLLRKLRLAQTPCFFLLAASNIVQAGSCCQPPKQGIS